MDEEIVNEPDSISLCKCLIDGVTPNKIVISARKLQILSNVTRTEEYLQERRIPELIRFLFTKVLVQQSNKPLAYIEKLLDNCMLFRAGHGVAPVLYEKRHLEAVLKSFDPGQRGWLSRGQLRRAYTTLGMTPLEFSDEKILYDTALENLMKTQESELYSLISAGLNKEVISKDSDRDNISY